MPTVTLNVSDGTKTDAYVSRLATKTTRGIIVLQEAFGVNSHIRDVSDRFAREGYVAIAPELFHRTAPGFEGDYNNFQAVMPHMQAMTNEGAEADCRAAFEWLQSQGANEIYAAGFCMGGRIAFVANSVLPFKAVASFYGGRINALLDRAAAQHGRVLFGWGELDKHIPPEQRAEVIEAMKKAGKSYVNVEFSDADHGFICDERASYNARAAREAWALMREFFRE